ncbi:MAG TPA: hypothetical protein DCW31_08065 [Lactobacillus sp.]|nr:hypothetical protein [Lactobacillus sp.]
MKTNIDLPLDASWSRDELVTVTRLYELVLEANETGVNREQLLTTYNKFTRLIPSRGEQRRLDRQFEKESGVGIYATIKIAQASSRKRIQIDE